MITVVDYGAANLLSITRALEASGARVEVSDVAERIVRAEALVLPGVGAAGSAMRRLRASGLDVALRERVSAGRPLLGVCLGMQLLFDWLEEDDCQGLGLLAGSASLLRGVPKVPHMGWNSLTWETETLTPLARRMFASVAPGWHAYFVHSYVCRPTDPSQALAWTDYGGPVCAAVGQDALLGLQFHPEKSGAAGVRLLRDWVAAVTTTSISAPPKQASL